MGLTCPMCGQDSLKIKSSLEMPPDVRSDEITVQLIECSQCGFKGVGVYEESRRGRLDSESVDHYGYGLKNPEWKRLAALIKTCPEPRRKDCDCPSHGKLNEKSRHGRWSGLDGFELGDYFNIVYR